MYAARLRDVCSRFVPAGKSIEPGTGGWWYVDPDDAPQGVEAGANQRRVIDDLWWDHPHRPLWGPGVGLELVYVKADGTEGDEIDAALSQLEVAMVNLDAYQSALDLGDGALPAEFEGLSADEIRQVLERITGHVREYAADVPDRIAARVRDVLDKIADDPDFQAKLDDQLEAFRSAVTRYAEPAWGAGQESYGRGLDQNGVLLVWVLDDGVDNCPDCIDLAEGSPYTAENLPTWPKGGDTICLDRCYCEVHADQESFDAAIGAEDEGD